MTDCKDQALESAVEVVKVTCKHGYRGGAGTKLNEKLAERMIAINDKSWGKLLCKNLTGNLSSEGHECGPASVRQRHKELSAMRRRCYTHQTLTLRHKSSRLLWVLIE